MKILIVDDDESVRPMLEKALSREGFDIQTAADGVLGWESFQKVQPDIVLLDILMPRMNGLELLGKIRGTDSDAIVIMTTAQNSADYTLQALRLKANDYMVKPLFIKELILRLRKYVGLLKDRTEEQEILGLIFHRELGMRIGNQLEPVNKIVNRLVHEAGSSLPKNQRLGIHLGIAEILINAIEHGNLEITAEEKKHAMESGALGKMMESRAQDPRLSKRQVLIQFKMNAETCTWTISDEGSGFDWRNMPDPLQEEKLLGLHGRGILLTLMSFDEVKFLGNGSKVELVKHLRPPQA